MGWEQQGHRESSHRRQEGHVPISSTLTRRDGTGLTHLIVHTMTHHAHSVPFWVRTELLSCKQAAAVGIFFFQKRKNPIPNTCLILIVQTPKATVMRQMGGVKTGERVKYMLYTPIHTTHTRTRVRARTHTHTHTHTNTHIGAQFTNRHKPAISHAHHVHLLTATSCPANNCQAKVARLQFCAVRPAKPARVWATRKL